MKMSDIFFDTSLNEVSQRDFIDQDISSALLDDSTVFSFNIYRVVIHWIPD